MVLASLLEDEGLAVDLAESVADVRAKLAGDDAGYDVVLLDQHLGDGLGTSLVPALRARVPQAKLMLISGSADDLPPGVVFDATVPKGRDFNDVMVLIRQLLGAPKAP